MNARRNAIFISYRRRDSEYAVDRLAARLKQAFGDNTVFRDVGSIRMGHSVGGDIRAALGEAAVGLVVIGPSWLEPEDGGKGDAARPRLSDPEDWVRIEVETLLQRRLPSGEAVSVVPVFLGGAKMPKVTDLPDSLALLRDREGLYLRPEPEFDDSVRRLIGRVGKLLGVNPRAEPIEGADPKTDISRIVRYAPAELIGREDEMNLLEDAWERVREEERKGPHIVTFVAFGGEGKTSLVAKWAAELAHQGWPSCDAAFAWSFYSQGTREQMAASSDLFLKEALTFFGNDAEKEFAASNASAFEKGQCLGRIVGKRRNLLILDGLEPLQYAPTSPTPGELKDEGIAALLKGLAAASRGLCVVTTRYSLPELRAFWQTTAPEVKLLRLSRAAGVHLLKTLGVRGSELRNIPRYEADGKIENANEFEILVEDVRGHALTLNLLGTYLRDAHDGDIRKRDLVKFSEAETANEHPNHASHVMDAYVRWMVPTGIWPWIKRWFNGTEQEIQNNGKRALALLKLLGLFDRPAAADCLNALWKGEPIAGLTEPIIGLSCAQRNLTLKRLEDAKLLTVTRAKGSGELLALDAHPLVREYFAKRLREEQPEGGRAAHRRLYEHLCATTMDKPEARLDDLQPLYQAVAHGCQAGMQQEACDRVYRDRILRGTGNDGFYSATRLGAFGSDLGAIACFFEQTWTKISPSLRESDGAWLLGEAALSLRSLGRLTEALEPMRAGLEMDIQQRNSRNAAISASNLSELELTLGKVNEALGDAKQAVEFADRTGDAFWRMAARIPWGDALHHSSCKTSCHREALAIFQEAEAMQSMREPFSPRLYSLQGFKYCDFLLAPPQRAAWQAVLESAGSARAAEKALSPAPRDEIIARHLESCREIIDRATKTLTIAKRNEWLLEIGLDHLTRGRAELYKAVLSSAFTPSVLLSDPACADLTAAVKGLRRARTTHHLPRGLLTRAWLRFLNGASSGPQSAQADLDEAWEIAERGPMRLFMADIHLYRARLFFREAQYPWESPRADLAAAEKLIHDCGYHRRDEELAEAKAAILPR